MKMSIKTASLLAVSALFYTACSLDTLPEGATVTDQQKQEIVEANPERIAADAAALTSMIFSQNTLKGGYANDFGIPSICIAHDYNGPDMVGADNDYNWFSVACDYTDRDPDYIVPAVEWNVCYNYLKAANDLLKAIPADTENETLRVYRGQALVGRAFVLFNLVQRFQFTYKGHEDAPSIPLVTDEMSADEAAVNPRAAVGDVYAQIMSDLNDAVDYLEGYTRPNCSLIDQQVVYGMRARVNLVMNNWAEAAADAEKALAGHTPYTVQEVSKPTFQDAHGSWIWGCIINEADLGGSYGQNWQSWLGSLNDGYATGVATYAMINVELYNKIPATDVRKGWWVDEDLKSPLIDNLSWPGYSGQPIGPLKISEVKEPFLPYTNVKFGPDGDKVGNTVNAGDWPLMRAEEMIFIQAEATAMAGNLQGGKTILENFVKSYRDASYTSKASNAADFQNEVWFQRRVELWGEGFAWLDMMRLKKPLVRFHGSRKEVSNFPDAFRFNIPAEDPIFLCRIPRGEINANEGISQDDNNTGEYPIMDQNPSLLDGVTD